jgi:hypothetical protein
VAALGNLQKLAQVCALNLADNDDMVALFANGGSQCVASKFYTISKGMLDGELRVFDNDINGTSHRE